MKYVLTQPRRGHIQQSQRWPSYDFEFLAFAQSRVESTENFHNIVNLQRNKFNDQLVHFLSSTNILVYQELHSVVNLGWLVLSRVWQKLEIKNLNLFLFLQS